MTTAQKNGLKYAAAILGAGLTIAFSAGMAQRTLEGKEDREAHDADVRMLQSADREERSLRELQHIRDSATMSVVLERVTDLSCQQNPTRSYCR